MRISRRLEVIQSVQILGKRSIWCLHLFLDSNKYLETSLFSVTGYLRFFLFYRVESIIRVWLVVNALLRGDEGFCVCVCVLDNVFYIFVLNMGMRKTICCFISVCPSVLSEQWCSVWSDLAQLALGIWNKTCPQNSGLIKGRRKCGTLCVGTCRCFISPTTIDLLKWNRRCSQGCSR
jgi:hypothetical protein